MSAPGEAGSAAPSPGEASRFCVRAGNARYAFDAALVSEVVRLGALTRLPGAPPTLPGVFIHRGEVLAVLDLCQVLGQAAVTPGPSSRVAVLSVGPWRLALLADALEGLCALEEEPERVPAESGPAAAWLVGVGRDRRGPVALLDLPRLIAAARQRSVG